MREFRPIFWLVALLLVGLPSPGFGEESGGDEREKLRKHVRSAVEAVKAEDFSRAAEHYMDAHELSPRPMLLYNAAYAYGRAGRLKSALDAARRAVDAGLDEPKYAVRNRARLHGWRVTRRAQRRATAVAKSVDIGIDTGVSDGSQPSRPTAAGPSLRWIGAGTAAAGSGVLVGALLIDRKIASESDRLRAAKRQRDREAYEKSLQQIEKSQLQGRILFVTGSALLVGGAALFAIDLFERTSEGRTSLRPTAGADGIGVVLEGAF